MSAPPVSMKVLPLVTILAACGTAPPPRPGISSAAGERELQIPTDLAAEVEYAEFVGYQLHLIAQASAVGTEFLHAQVPEHGRGELAGWITVQEMSKNACEAMTTARHPPRSGCEPTFWVMFLTNEPSPRLSYTVRVPTGGKPTLETHAPMKAPDERVMKLWRARQVAAVAVPPGPRPLTPVALPLVDINDPARHVIYLLTTATAPGETASDAHYKVTVTPEGLVEQVVSLSQVETNAPLETHVMASLTNRGQHVHVRTRCGAWSVRAGKIAYTSATGPP
jgi:hypothetical protein